ncbi:MAG: pyrimidine/purine nucleoside phosphorylase [Verrucomicrobiales bacterium]
MEFTHVTASAIAKIYFDGKVISHAITTENGEAKSFGVILPGEYHFATEKAERMEITQGSCSVKLDGEESTMSVKAGAHFDIPAQSGFTISADEPCQYICSYDH